MNQTLILILFALVFLQPNYQRFVITLMFAGLSLVHMVTAPIMSDEVYYLSAVFCDFISIILISCFSQPTRFADKMIVLCTASFLVNVFGWFQYEIYAGPELQEYLFVAVYVMALYIFLARGKTNETIGGDSMAIHFRSMLKSNYLYQTLHKKAQA